MYMTSLLIISFIIIMVSFIMNYMHLLMSLLYLEAMMLCMVMYIPSSMNLLSSPMHQISLILLTFSACEASLGLSLIVKLTRMSGSDLLSSSSINKC